MGVFGSRKDYFESDVERFVFFYDMYSVSELSGRILTQNFILSVIFANYFSSTPFVLGCSEVNRISCLQWFQISRSFVIVFLYAFLSVFRLFVLGFSYRFLREKRSWLSN